MDTEPVNPFQSPQAEDLVPPNLVTESDWNEVRLGLIIAPMARPTLWGIEYLILEQSIHLDRLLIVTLFSYAVAVPAIAIAAWLYRSNRLTPLTAFLAWGWVPLVTGISLILLVNFGAHGIGPQSFDWQVCFIAVPLMMAPFFVFALYLAYLRRRDQTRQRNAAG